MKTSERWCIINAEMNNKRIGVLASALVGCIFTLSAQDLTMKITKRYLNLPVSHQVDRALMTFDVGGRQERVFEIRLASGKPDYWVFCDMSALKNKEIKISYTGNKTGINKIYQADEITGQDSLYKETTVRKSTILNVEDGTTILMDCCIMTVNITCSTNIIRMNAAGGICIGGMQ